VHQQLLEDKSEILFKHFQTIYSEIDDNLSDKEKEELVYIHFLVESASFFELYFHSAKAKEILDEVFS